MNTPSAQARAVITQAVNNPTVISRFWALTRTTDTLCGICWVGSISGQGHGRFWIGKTNSGKDVAVVAHRFAYALTYSVDTLWDPALQVTHGCDEPICVHVDPAHVRAGTASTNTTEWHARRDTPHSPLRDTRGALGRALAARAAALAGTSVTAALREGLSELDRYQDTLW